MSDEKIEAYGLTKVLNVSAEDGLVLIRAQMFGGEIINLALHPRTSADLRPQLRDAERYAVIQRNEKRGNG